MTWQTDDIRARVLLSRLAEPADTRLQQRISEVGAAATARELLTHESPLRHADTLLVRMTADPDRMIDDDLAVAERLGARVLVPGTSQWPTQLDQLGERAPVMLWVLGVGDLRLLALRSLAVVGARAATPYGVSGPRSSPRPAGRSCPGERWASMQRHTRVLSSRVEPPSACSRAASMCPTRGLTTRSSPRSLTADSSSVSRRRAVRPSVIASSLAID